MHKEIALDMMPDGTDFISWERPADFARTLHGDAGHPQADDANPGTDKAPFASITVHFNQDTQGCECTVDVPLPACPPLPEAGLDYHGLKHTGATVAPGPFAHNGWAGSGVRTAHSDGDSVNYGRPAD